MNRIGFLACAATLPAARSATAVRRGDAYEHDLTIAALRPAFEACAMRLDVIDWEAPLEAFSPFDAVLLGTAWNYQDRPEMFLAKLEALARQGVGVFNPPPIVRWNMSKTYLRELARTGVPTIPTVWYDRADAGLAHAAMDELECDRLVVKQQIGAGAIGQELLVRGEIADDWRFDRPAMLQPFLPAIADQGELSFVFVDEAFSHAVRKLPARGDYRIQSLYGGREEAWDPGADEIAAAAAALAALPFDPPLYIRVDMVPAPGSTLTIMEVELIEPYLYPEQGPQIGELLARAVAARLSV